MRDLIFQGAIFTATSIASAFGADRAVEAAVSGNAQAAGSGAALAVFSGLISVLAAMSLARGEVAGKQAQPGSPGSVHPGSSAPMLAK